MAIVYGSYSTGGSNAFRVGYEITAWSAVTSSSTSVTADFQLFVGNQYAVSSDTQTFNLSWAGVSQLGGITSPFSVEIVSSSSTNTVNGVANANNRNIGPARTVTFNYPAGSYGSSPGNFTGTITGLGSATALAKGFYTGGAATCSFSIPIPARPGAAPSAPNSVTSTPSNGSVSISFTAPTVNDPATTSYQYSTNNTNPWTTVPSVPFSLSGTNGTAKTVYVRAVNAVSEGPSASATSTPYTIPSAPASVTATPGNGTATVTFTAAPNGGSDITSYEGSFNNAAPWSVINSQPVVFSWGNGSLFTVYIRAWNAAGVGPSTVATTTPYTVPGVPASISADTSVFGTIGLTWTAPASNGGSAITSYVLRNGTTVLQNTTGTSYSHTGLAPYTEYSYTVTAANAAGEGTAASITPRSMGGVVNVRSSAGAWIKVVPQVRNSANTAWVTGQARARNNSTSEWKYGT